MNAAEHIVESYFRLCKGCFTLSDRKVENGVGRQLDLLAVNLQKKLQLHIEVAVTHRTHWCPTRDQLTPYFEKKFFGVPPERKSVSGKGTDFEKGKSYFDEIQNAYTSVGFNPEKISRVVVCWFVKEVRNAKSQPALHSRVCMAHHPPLPQERVPSQVRQGPQTVAAVVAL
jgi:hypothetical protein